MFLTEEKIKKDIITSDGEEEFQIRYVRGDNAGVLTSRSNKSYFILDSVGFWYDLIQEKYPAKQKCQCKNDYFKLCFHYVPRIGTDDYRAVELISRCMGCGRQRKLAEVDIDYSPTSQLFEKPITYCEQPRIKYKTHSLKGYWKEEELGELIGFLSQKGCRIYCWFWNRAEKKRQIKQMTAVELKSFLFLEKERYIKVYFSTEPLDEVFADSPSGEDGVCVDRDVWRKREIILLNAPLLVAAAGAGKFYSMDFSSEYMEEGQVKAKSEAFCRLVREVLARVRERLK